MNGESLQFGAEIANDLPASSATLITTPQAPATLRDLLQVWEQHPPKELKMLRSTASLLSNFFATPLEDIAIGDVARERNGFRSFLEKGKYKENSIRAYVNYVRILLTSAQAAGWAEGNTLSQEWNAVISLADEQNCGELARHLAASRKNPKGVTAEDVDRWVLQVSRERLAHSTAVKKRRHFWRILRDQGFATTLPLCLIREDGYGVPLSEFPDELRKEVEGILAWKQKDYAWDRPKDARHRPVTAKRLEHVIRTLYGYAINVAGACDISTLPLLARKHLIGGFIEWARSERKVEGQTLQRNFRLLAAVLRQHPRYVGLELDWFDPLLESIPVVSDAVLKKRKAEKTLPYSVIESIPGQIRRDRPSLAQSGVRAAALSVREEFIIRFLSVLPWRQLNLRGCRIAGPHPNLYKGPVPEITTMDLPLWAIDELKINPEAEFWQFHFTEEETKTGCTADALLPRQLIVPLEEYLTESRHHLLRGDDPGTLLLNEAGKAMSRNAMTAVVSKNTLRYGGRRVTPHLFRDVVCRAWLKEHPKDYLTVSKMLWHATPNEVIRTYGSLFNESSGVCSMESWLEERAGKTKG